MIIVIAGTPELKFRSLELVRADDFADWPRMHELPDAGEELKAGRGEIVMESISPTIGKYFVVSYGGLRSPI
jgi:hypothetical protein